MPNTLRVKRGLAATLPNGASGEPLFTTDTYELYIGKGDGTNQRYQKYIASGTTSQYLRGDGSLETHNLDSLTDVVVSSPSNGQFLKYNGTNWINSAGGFLSGGATAAGQVGVFDATTNIVGYTTFTYDTVTDKLSMTNGYVNNTLTVDGQLVIKSESGASAYTRGLKFPDNSYGGAGDIAGLRLHNAGGENIILELYAGNDSLDTINFAVAAGGSTYNDNVTINGNKIWNAGNLPSPLSSTGSITSGEIAIFSNSTTVYSDTALFWDNSLNRLGIGGNSPNAQVGVSTSSGVNAFGYKTSGASYYEMVLVYDNTTYGHLFQTGRGASTSARNITFLNASSTVSIDESGNMGIGLIAPNPGTSGPGGLGLDIYASTTAALALHNATSGTGISAGGRIYYNSTNMTIRNLSTGNMTMTVDNGNFTVITLGAENIKVEGSTGKVGIGAPASIAEMLTVNGSIQQSAVISSMLKANASGKIIAAVSNTDFQAPITLTTTGTSGAATFNGTTLNIPQYQGVLTNPVTGTGTNNEIAYFNATGSTIASLSTATYPSLTELSYVKGVTSAIQTQLNGKQNTLTNPVTGTGTSGYHAKFTATGSTIGNSLIYDNGVRAISVGNSSTNSWASPFYVIEGGSYGQFLGYQTNAAAIKLGVNAYFNGSNYIYTNSNLGVAILDLTGDATNALLNFYTAPAGSAGGTATLSPRFIIDNAGDAYFSERLAVGFTSGTPNGRIDFRNPANAIIVGKNTVGGTNTYSSIRLTTANSGGVGDSIGEIRGLSTNVNNRDTALTFLTTEGSGSQTEKMRITSGGNVGIGTTSPSSILHIQGASGSTKFTLQPPSGQPNIIEFLTNAGVVDARIKNESTQLQFETGTSGTPKMVITSGGNVGIGVTSVNGLLALKASISDTPVLRFQNNITSGLDAALSTYASSTQTYLVIGTNIFINSTGNFQRFNTSYESSAIAFDDGTIGFSTNTTAANATRRMTITSGGNVGIGTTSPSASDWNASATLLHIYQNSTNGSILKLESSNAAGVVAIGNNQMQIATTTDDPMIFYTNSAERMRITSGGNVGIGVTPTATNGVTELALGSSNTNPRLSGIRDGSNAYIIYSDSGGTDFYERRNLYLRFGANNTEYMRITSGGQLYFSRNTGSVDVINIESYTGHTGRGILINMDTTADAITIGGSGTQNAINVTSSGKKVIISNLGGTGNRAVYSDANGTLTNSSSDLTLKTNIENITYGLNTVLSLKPVSYNWIPEKLGTQKEIGFIAQEVQQLIPEVIGINSDETLSLDYPKLTAVLVKAIQEQQSQIEELKSKLN